MILIPGLSCPGDVWDETVAHYKDRYQMHVLSLAGFRGRTARARSFPGQRPRRRRRLCS